MNYIRIYEAFIKDRQAKEPTLTGYTERHHILPRSLGGGDESDNLVALTPEDHFFAHLLLAKAHGGRLASAAYLMAMSCNGPWRDRFRLRARYGLARRITARCLSESMSGSDNQLFNSTKYEWINYRSGKKETSTLFDMHKKYGASRGIWTQVMTGERPSIKGWLLSIRKKDHKRSEKGQVNNFVHRDGRKFTGTQSEFCKHTGLSDASSWRIVHAKSVSRCGWRLDGVMDRKFNMPRDGSPSCKAGKVFAFKKDGITVTGDRNAIAAALGSTVGQISASICSIRAGRTSGYKGWKLVEEEASDARAA